LKSLRSTSLAAALVKHSDILDLTGVTSLAPAAAAKLVSLSKFKERDQCLRLDRLGEVSLETLKSLMAYSGDLFLGLESITLTEARVLSEFRGSLLGLMSVSKITAKKAEILSHVAAGELVLVGLEKISKKVAQHLLNHDNVVTEFDLKYIANSEEGNK
jgi:hypothetical protein